jgi:hypothetical protein
MAYTLTEREFVILKARLTRAKNSGDPEKVIAETKHAFAIFEEKGYPDAWNNWRIAEEDARLELCRKHHGAGGMSAWP